MAQRIKCIVCGKGRYPSDLRANEDGDLVCTDCIDNKNLSYCDRCGLVVMSGGRLCRDCSNLVYKKIVNDYRTKPTPLFINSTKNVSVERKRKKIEIISDVQLNGMYKPSHTRYYGFEFEFNYASPGVARAMMNNLYKDKVLYNKHDSSISSGVEIVTSPLDRDASLEVIAKMGEYRDYLKKKVRDYSSGAGVHIHVNRGSVDGLTTTKLSMLLNGEGANGCIGFLNNLFNRSTDQYCKYKTSNSVKNLTKGLNRHIALNVGNKDTLEFRMFGSTVEEKEIVLYIDAVDSMIEFCSVTPLRNIHISKWVEYVDAKFSTTYLNEKIKSIQDDYSISNYDNGLIMSKSTQKIFAKFNISKYLSEYVELCDICKGESTEKIISILEDIHNGREIDWKDVESSAITGGSTNKIIAKIAKLIDKPVREYIEREVSALCA